MKKHLFYHKYANTPLAKRFKILSLDATHLLDGKTLSSVYQEIHDIDDKIRDDEIRRENLLKAVEPFLQ